METDAPALHGLHLLTPPTPGTLKEGGVSIHLLPRGAVRCPQRPRTPRSQALASDELESVGFEVQGIKSSHAKT